jgi:NADH-quinone oxidoreductase subunit K
MLALLAQAAQAAGQAVASGAQAAGNAAAGAAAVGAQNAAAGAAQAAAVTGHAGNLRNYLIVSSVLFALGIATILTRRNVLYVLMGVELILNAANLNFVAFARFGGYGMDGQMFALFVVILAAAEAAIALAIVLRIFHDFGSIDVTRTDSLRD